MANIRALAMIGVLVALGSSASFAAFALRCGALWIGLCVHGGELNNLCARRLRPSASFKVMRVSQVASDESKQRATVTLENVETAHATEAREIGERT